MTLSESKPQVAIVGLGLIGGSIGLALRESGVTSAVVGHDKDLEIGKRAKKLGAVDRVDWNLIAACADADLVILAIPVGAMRETLEVIGPELRHGCVVMDTASLKGVVLDWAIDSLSERVYFVGTDPILPRPIEREGGLASARADLFRGGLFCLVPAPGVPESAVKVVTDLVALLGANPLFFDAAEHDGLLAAVDHLPSLLALALLEMAVNQPSWRELRKVAGASFESSTYLPLTDPAALGDLSVVNRDNILRWLDTFSASLASIRCSVAEGQAETLGLRFQKVLEERQKWLQDRDVGRWDERLGQEIPPQPGLLETLLGGLWGKRPKVDQ
jgi:prephenate dehydrogenase